MNKALQDFYSTFVFKDNAKTKYYFDVVSVRSDGTSEIEYPIISIRQNRRNATGAEQFKAACEQIEGTKSAIAVIIREYNGFADDCQPVSENRVELRKQKNSDDNNMEEKSKTQTMQQTTQPPVAYPFVPLGSAESTNAYIGMVNAQLQSFGLGSLPDVMNRTSATLALQEKYDDAKMVIQELKLDNKQQLAEIARLKDEIEKHKDQYRQLQYKMQDLQREYKNDKDSLEKNLMWTNVIGRGLGNALIDKLDLANKLSGLVGTATPQKQSPKPSAQPQAGNLDDISLQSVNTETDGKVQEITKYIHSLDKDGVEKVYSICEFISTSDDRMNGVIQYIESRK